MTKELGDVPQIWEMKTLGQVCEIRNGKNQKEVADADGAYPIYGSAGIMGFANNYLCEEGATIVGRKGTINRPIFVKTKFWNVDTAFGLCPNKEIIIDKYLYYFCVGFNFHSLDKSTTIPSLAKSDLQKIVLPVPQKSQQKAIVSKIEELFSELDKGIESLRIAQQQLKTYRQSVLKWAFEGRLTSENVKNGELPKGWLTIPLGDLMEGVRNGYSKKPDEEGMYKILRISSVRPNRVNIEDIRFLKAEIGPENSVCENDLLFTRYNGSIDFVGVCGKVPKLAEKLFYPDKLIRCRPKIKHSFHSSYIAYAANSRLARQFILTKIKTTAGQTGISGNDIKSIPIPLATLDEQCEIVNAIEARLSLTDKLEETITQSLQRAEALRQSILRKAFEGKLI